MTRPLTLLSLLWLATSLPMLADGPMVRIGVVVDGPWSGNEWIRVMTRDEVLALTEGEFGVLFPEDASLGGEEEESSKANASIAEQLPLAGLIIILLLVSQFNSIRRPLIILIAIPLGLIGVSIGLVVMRSYMAS